jgi:hypothetical protein
MDEVRLYIRAAIKGKTEMKATQLKALLAGLASLTPSQRKKLAAALSPAAPPALRVSSMDALHPQACPHRLAEKVVRNGICDGL